MMLYLSYLYCPALESVFRKASNPDMHGDRLPSHSAHLASLAHAGLSGACGQGLLAAHQHAAQHLLSLTKQWLIAVRHLTQY